MKFFLLLLLCIFFKIGISQTPELIKLSCTYISKYKKESSNNFDTNVEVFKLDIASSFSKYYSDDKRIGDSLLKEDKKKGRSLDDIIADTKKYRQDKGNIVIYNNNENLHVYEKVISKFYSYSDSLSIKKWKILNDTLTINNIFCQKAEINFRGRDYIAWFSKDIPVAYGPWKFYGLPGLIVKVFDTKNFYSWEIIQLSVALGNDSLVFNRNPMIKTTLKEISKLKRRFIEDPIGSIEAATGASIKFEDSMGQMSAMLKKATVDYNPIELNTED